MTDTTADMKERCEETFGPLKSLIPFDSLDEAVAIANGTEYGLSASVYTGDRAQAKELVRRVKSGSVNVNDSIVTYVVPSLPFGGVKKSGLGRYHGAEGLRTFSDIKSVTEFWWKMKREFFWYPIPTATERAFPHLMLTLFGEGLAGKQKGVISVLGALIKKK